MASKFVGQARRTSLVTTYGVGSLFPTESDSMMICGLDDWPEGPQVFEPRLAASLGVAEFRSPAAGRKAGDIPVVRFPEWAFCPDCRSLAPHWSLANDSRRCKACNAKVSPSRFIVCCENGHIEDFPYRSWVHQGEYVRAEGHDLRFTTRGKSSSLSDVIVECSCGQKRSMFGSFDFTALKDIKGCSGQRPWLPNAESESCSGALRTLQRGSSNAWFAETRSAISIPSVRSRARAFAARKFRDATPTADPVALASMFKPPEGCTADDVAAAILELRTPAASGERPSQQDLRAEEYRALVNGLTEGLGTDEFLCAKVDISSAQLPPVIAQVSRVSRLREVRALAGFSRVTPMTVESDKDQETRRAPLASADVRWLPALEVLGEGIFLRLDTGQLNAWSDSPFAVGRVRSLLEAQDQLSPQSMASGLDVSAKRLVLHSLAHALIDECSLTAGYPTASLRERLYTDGDQSGILIYTATADSAGSLGGLAALSDPHRFAAVLASALQRASWCTSDPVCLESGPSGVDGLNLAACHACLLLPETSCEGFNLVLDRGTLVGTTESAGAGLFSALASGGH
ncbi:DrmB family protein [Janibacter cremeus]|uniref:DrmB family protein n=1 Tax=Janibacter cremeus TaxID=1285192 RepID=UPI003D646ACF